MKQFLILFREPDGRLDPHPEEDIRQHRLEWQAWMDNLVAEKRLAGGKPLTLAGNVIKGPRHPAQPSAHQPASNHQPASTHEPEPIHQPERTHQPEPNHQLTSQGPYRIGTEIVGGYLLINAGSLEEATAIIQTCPIFDYGGFAEVRETMDIPGESLDSSPVTSSAYSTHPAAGPSPEPASKPETEPSHHATAAQLEENKAIVRRFNLEFIQDGDTSLFYELVDPQVVNHTAPPGMSKDADGMLALITAFKKALPDLTVEISHQVAENDLVVTRKSFHATHTGEIMGIPPSGKKVTLNIIDIIRLRNGKYTDHWSIRDSSDLLNKARK